VRPGADEDHLILGYVVEHKPIGFDVALPHTGEVSRQFVGAVAGGKLAELLERFDRRIYLFQVLAPPFLSPQIPPVLRCRFEGSHARPLYQGAYERGHRGTALILRQARYEGLTLSLSKGEARVSSSARWYKTTCI
jgi:hypothetical protein